jgi:hypothetical protein
VNNFYSWCVNLIWFKCCHFSALPKAIFFNIT